jgi:hypothetical protein
VKSRGAKRKARVAKSSSDTSSSDTQPRPSPRPSPRQRRANAPVISSESSSSEEIIAQPAAPRRSTRVVRPVDRYRPEKSGTKRKHVLENDYPGKKRK